MKSTLSVMNSTPSETTGLFHMSAPRYIPIIPQGDLENLSLFQMRTGLIIKARHKHRNIEVSIKFLTNQSVRDRKVTELLKDVTQTECKSKRILPLMGVYSCPQFLGLVREWMCNGSLDFLIHQRDSYSNVPVPLRLRILLDVAEGMSHLHGMDPPVIHQALKPSNILLDEDYRAKISNCSMRKWKKWTSSSTLSIPSNPKDVVYMAPECLQGKPPSTKGDVYSYGMLTYEVLTGRRPHEDKQNLQDIILAINNGARPNITDKAFPVSLLHRDTLIHLITSCWTEEPQNRPQFRDCENLLRSVFETFDSTMVLNAAHSLALIKGTMSESTKDGHHTRLFCIDVKNLELPCDEIPSKLPPNKNIYLERNNIVCDENSTTGRLNSEQKSLNISENQRPITQSPPKKGKASTPQLGSTLSCQSSKPPSVQHCKMMKEIQPLMQQTARMKVSQSEHRISDFQLEESQTPCIHILKQCRECLIKYMTEGRLNHVLDVLRSQKLLTKASYETITAQNTQTSQTRALLDMCLCLGEAAARVVVDLLPGDKKVQFARSTSLQYLVDQR